MEVQFKDKKAQFNFQEGDYITIVVRYLYVEDPEDERYYHGTLTKIEEEGFWTVLDDDKTKEEYFSFIDIESVIPGHLIPFLSGFTRRQDIRESE